MQDTEKFHLAIVLIQIIGALIIWFILFLIVAFILNKKYYNEKKVNPKSADFNNELLNEIQLLYHIRDCGTHWELHSEKFQDIIAKGIIKIEFRNKGHPTYLVFTYKRRLKFTGYLLILFSLAFCYLGVLVPILIVQETKKNSFAEIDRIFSIAKSI